jgi:hypothetical protein
MQVKPCIAGLAAAALAAGACYYKPEHRQAKAHPDYMSEADAERLIAKTLDRHGVKFITNMRLKRGDEVEFVADGYDQDLRVGFEYRSHEGRDFQGEPGGSPDGLSEAEIAVLDERQEVYHEYFLIVPEGTRDEVNKAVRRFTENLYQWEVLKRAKKADKSDALFPDQKRQGGGDALPWETTGDLKQRRLEMEKREKARQAGEDLDADVWQGGEDEDQPEPESRPAADPVFAPEPEPEDKSAAEPEAERKKPAEGEEDAWDDDIWDDEEEDF